MITLTQKQILILNDRWRDYIKDNPTSTMTFMNFRKEFMREIDKNNIEKAKREYAKNGRKIRALLKAGKTIG
jgi:uncharacterized protein YlzI (FlbEa/FlbD family)